MTTFAQLGLPEPLVRVLSERGITEAFPIQGAAIPDALSGADICGMAPTGSGKTLAFGLPLLARIEPGRKHRPTGLVLAPTRELAEQIVQELAPFAKTVSRQVVAIYGGVGYGHQKAALRRGADVVVATPGRLEDLMEQGIVSLDEVSVVVLDEADRMADMGFLPAMRRILDTISNDRQTLLFSATLDGDIALLSRTYQRDPIRHEAVVEVEHGPGASHHFWLVQHHDRTRHTAEVIAAEGQSIVFTRTRHGADRLAKQLGEAGVSAVALHGGRSQQQRTSALRAFTAGKASALVATDVAARGIHVDSVAAVVHFDPAGDSKDYLHRSGRTARAGQGGKVITMVTDGQRRDVQRMVNSLRIDAGFERPDAPRTIGVPAKATHTPADQNDSTQPKRPVRAEANGSQSVYVANLPWHLTEEELGAHFGVHGFVHQAIVINDRRTGRSKGYGFVDLDPSAAEQAVHKLHGSDLGGRTLTVRLARPSRYAG